MSDFEDEAPTAPIPRERMEEVVRLSDRATTRDLPASATIEAAILAYMEREKLRAGRVSGPTLGSFDPVRTDRFARELAAAIAEWDVTEITDPVPDATIAHLRALSREGA